MGKKITADSVTGVTSTTRVTSVTSDTNEEKNDSNIAIIENNISELEKNESSGNESLESETYSTIITKPSNERSKPAFYNITINSNQVYKLAIDLGSANLKIAGEVNGNIKYKKLKSRISFDAIDDNYVVKYNGKTLHFGVGDSLIQQDKTQREYIEETILLSVYQLYGATKDNSIKIDLAVGLPLNLYKSDSKSDEFSLKLHSMTKKTIAGQVNNENVSVKIQSIELCAEGYSAFLSLHEKMDTKSPFLILDMGYRTTDVLSIDVNSEDNTLAIGSYRTFDKGLLEVFVDIQKHFLNDTGYNLAIDSIEDRILNAPKVKIGQRTEDIREWIKYGQHTVRELFREIELYFPDILSRNIYPVGGGAYIINEIVEYMLENNEIRCKTEIVGTINELIYANVAGYFMQLEDED